jgi:hypothetical protein
MYVSKWKYPLLYILICCVALVGTFNYHSLALTNPTPTPTLLLDEATPSNEILTKLQKLMAPNTECIFPCFWGFEQGRTSISQIRTFVERNLDDNEFIAQQLANPSGKTLNKFPVYSFNLPFGSKGLFKIKFAADSDRVVHTDLLIIRPSDWMPKSNLRISELLNTLGTPSEILVNIQGPYPPTFVWTFIYHDRHTLVQYEFDFDPPWSDQKENEPTLMCPHLDSTLSIQAWFESEQNLKPIEEHLPQLRYSTDKYWNVKQMTGLTPKEFAEKLSTDSETCLKALSYNELVKQKYPFVN